MINVSPSSLKTSHLNTNFARLKVVDRLFPNLNIITFIHYIFTLNCYCETSEGSFVFGKSNLIRARKTSRSLINLHLIEDLITVTY